MQTVVIAKRYFCPSVNDNSAFHPSEVRK